MTATTRAAADRQQIVIDCPLWVQKRMRRNLAKAAKERVNPARAKMASALLRTTRPEPKVTVPPVITKVGREGGPAYAPAAVVPAARVSRSTIWQAAKNGLRRFAGHVSRSLASQRFLHWGRSRGEGRQPGSASADRQPTL
jgi:hypothetical protein